MKKKKFVESLIKTAELAGVSRQEIMDFLLNGKDADPETLKAKPFKKKRSKATTKTAGEVPVKETLAKPEIPYEIVYADDVVSKEFIAGKEIKGVIFVLDGRRVFISARYAPKRMTKKESTEYCASIQVEGHPCEEGKVKHWKKGGILHCYLRRINRVMKSLGLETIDDRYIWSSSFDCSNCYWLAYPASGDMDRFREGNYACVRPVCLLD